MTEQEYKKQLMILDGEYLRKKKSLDWEYAFSNNTVKRGDIVSDHMGSIRVTGILYTVTSGMPQCVYVGEVLTKKGEVTKLKDKTRRILQSNLIK